VNIHWESRERSPNEQLLQYFKDSLLLEHTALEMVWFDSAAHTYFWHTGHAEEHHRVKDLCTSLNRCFDFTDPSWPDVMTNVRKELQVSCQWDAFETLSAYMQYT
jgi:hypothetical protein